MVQPEETQMVLAQVVLLKTQVALGLVVALKNSGTLTLRQQHCGAFKMASCLQQIKTSKKIIVEVDAITVVNLFSYENVEFDSTHPYSAIIIDYRSFL